MAKSVLELAVGTGQWDAGLKKAKSALDSFVSAQGGIQQALEKDSENVKKFVQMMGNMESSAKTVKGQMNDYKSAIEQLTLQYKDLTDAQKKNIGQDYLKSIDQLKTKFKEATNTAGELKNELNGTGGFMDALTSKLTVNIDAMKLFEVGLKAGSAALGVAKDAFFASEQNLDDWNRAVYSAHSVYDAFLTSLNTGDVSGFLSNIQQIVNAANDAYNAIDRLQTTQNIQTPKMQAKLSEVHRLETMLRTGRYIAPIDGRTPTKGLKDGDVLSDAQKEKVAQQLANAMKDIGDMTKTEVQRSTDAINALYKEQALQLGMSNKQFREGTASVGVFEENLRKAAKYREWEAAHTITTIHAGTGLSTTARTGGANPYEAYKGWGVFKDDGKLYQELLNQIRARTSAESQYYGQMGRAYRGINRAEGVSPYGGRGGSGSVGTNTKELTPLQEAQKKITDLTNEALTADEERRNVIKEEIAGLQKQVDKYNEIYNIISGKFDPTKIKAPQPTAYSALPLVENDSYTTARLSSLNSTYQSAMKNSDIGSAEFNMAWEHMVDATALTNLIQTAIKNGISLEGMEVPNLMDKLVSAEGLSNEQLQALVDYINQFMGENPIKLNFATGSVEGVKDLAKEAKVNMDAWNKAASAVNSMGSALQSLEDPSAKIAGIVAQAVANIALGFAQATASPATGAAGVFGWIAAATAGLATMTATITQIKSVTSGGFAEGGIVPGNAYSGDLLRTSDYGINSGELILNRSQQNSIAAQLQGGNAGDGEMRETYVRGETIYMALTNYMNRAHKSFKTWQ